MISALSLWTCNDFRPLYSDATKRSPSDSSDLQWDPSQVLGKEENRRHAAAACSFSVFFLLTPQEETAKNKTLLWYIFPSIIALLVKRMGLCASSICLVQRAFLSIFPFGQSEFLVLVAVAGVFGLLPPGAERQPRRHPPLYLRCSGLWQVGSSRLLRLLV